MNDFDDVAASNGADAVRDAIAATHLPPDADDAPDVERDYLSAQPQCDPAMFYGLIGDTARVASGGREISPVSAALAAMTWLSAQVGRNLIVPVGDKWRRLNLYGLHIGASAFAGKGESLALVQRIARTLHKQDASLARAHEGGVSTGEGLAGLIHDGFTAGKTDHPPILDKRLLIVEEELGALLARMRREGNTLSQAMRTAWDGVGFGPATKDAAKGGGIWVSKPHIAVHGCITPTELRERLTKGDMSNGFANRFLMIFAERVAVVPNPPRTPDDAVEDLAARFRSVIEWALRGYPDSTQAQALPMTSSARRLWDGVYRRWKRDARHDPLAALTERRYPMALRMAGLFAATDQATQTDVQHLEAGIAWVQHGIETVRYVFGSANAQERNDTAREGGERIRAHLIEVADWRSRTLLADEVFKKKIKASDLTAALDWLRQADARLERREVPSGTAKVRTEYRLILHAERGNRGERGNQATARNAGCGLLSENGGNQDGADNCETRNPPFSAEVRNAEKPVAACYPRNPRFPPTTETANESVEIEGEL